MECAKAQKWASSWHVSGYIICLVWLDIGFLDGLRRDMTDKTSGSLAWRSERSWWRIKIDLLCMAGSGAPEALKERNGYHLIWFEAVIPQECEGAVEGGILRTKSSEALWWSVRWRDSWVVAVGMVREQENPWRPYLWLGAGGEGEATLKLGGWWCHWPSIEDKRNHRFKEEEKLIDYIEKFYIKCTGQFSVIIEK
jgi:hypothetical protein